MATIDFNQKPYVVCGDLKGYMFIDNSRTYEELMKEVAEETTSPRGVESKLQIGVCDVDGETCYFLFKWLPNGDKRESLQLYHTYERALQEWCNAIYEYDFLYDELAYYTFDTYEGAVECIADVLEISQETALSQIKWHKKLQSLYIERERKSKIGFLKRSLQNANGKPTKALRQAIRNCEDSVQMWGNDYILRVPIQYSKEDLDMLQQAKMICENKVF